MSRRGARGARRHADMQGEAPIVIGSRQVWSLRLGMHV